MLMVLKSYFTGSANREKKVIFLSLLRLKPLGVFEACALFLFKAGYEVSVVLPNKAKQYLRAIGLKTKNDKIDASGLARMGVEQLSGKMGATGRLLFYIESLYQKSPEFTGTQNQPEEPTACRSA